MSEGFLTAIMFNLNFSLSVHVLSPLIELKGELSSWRGEGDRHRLCASASKSSNPDIISLFIHFTHTHSIALLLHANADYM